MSTQQVVNAIADMSAFAVMSLMLIVIAVIFGWAVLIGVKIRTTRLTPREEAVDLGRLPARFSRRFRASRLSPSARAWNRLVDEQDEARLKAQVVATSDRRLITAVSSALGLAIGVIIIVKVVAGSQHHESMSFESLARGLFSISMVYLAVGLLLSMSYGTYVVVRSLQHRSMPIDWQILEEGRRVTRYLEAPCGGPAWQKQLDLGEGRISTVAATGLIHQMEARLISFSRPPGASDTAGQISWRKHLAPRLTQILERRAELIDMPEGRLQIDDIEQWMDLVAAKMTFRSRDAVPRERIEIAPELLDRRTYLLAARSLPYGSLRHMMLRASVPLVFALSLTIVSGILFLIPGTASPSQNALQFSIWSTVLVVAATILGPILGNLPRKNRVLT